MEVYLVGGSVRDELLGLTIKDRDWVVVGSTTQEMLQQGFTQVGKDFPVFLHPQSKEEYALARTERKTAPGYTGFEFNSDASVTLEEDLLRRDLTINAIAKSSDGRIIDPYNGVQDIENKILRHVSAAFAEDPVRILRIARFAARYHHLGFKLADETLELMKVMVSNGEVNALVAERVWQETQRALTETTPTVFFEVLRECAALQVIFPELAALYGVPQVKQHHPEVDTGIHTMMVLEQAVKLSTDPRVRFAALCHDFGKGITPQDEWPKHHDHENKGVPLVNALCDRLKVPRDYRDIAVLVTRYHLYFHRAKELRAGTIVELFKNLDAFRRPERLPMFLLACEADSRGRTGYEDRVLIQPELLQTSFSAASSVDTKAITAKDLKGEVIAQQILQARILAVKQVLKRYAE